MTRALWTSLGALGLVELGAFTVAPEIVGLDAPRMLYVHVPLAWSAYAGWLVVGGAGLLHLLRRGGRLGALCVAAAEVTTPSAFLALATGLGWSRVAFDAYDPFRDPKLITTAVMFLSLAGLVVLSRTARAESRDRLVAAFAVLGVVTVPASFLASRISVHPDPTSGFRIVGGDVWAWLGAATLAMTLVLAAATRVRLAALRLQDASERAKTPPPQ